MSIKRITLATDRPILRNENGQIINEVGVTFTQWGDNLHKQYYQSVVKIKKGALSESNRN